MNGQEKLKKTRNEIRSTGCLFKFTFIPNCLIKAKIPKRYKVTKANIFMIASIILMHDHNGDGSYPSLATICELSDLSINTVKSAVKVIHEMKWITKTQRKTNGSWSSNLYENNIKNPFIDCEGIDKSEVYKSSMIDPSEICGSTMIVPRPEHNDCATKRTNIKKTNPNKDTDSVSQSSFNKLIKSILQYYYTEHQKVFSHDPMISWGGKDRVVIGNLLKGPPVRTPEYIKDMILKYFQNTDRFYEDAGHPVSLLPNAILKMTAKEK